MGLGLGSSSTLGIGLVIELRDRFTQNANAVNRSLATLHGNADRALKSSFNRMTAVGGAMTLAGLGIARGLQVATKEATDFQKVMLDIKALGGMSDSEMMGLGKLSKTLGPKYGRDAITVAEGMSELVKAGLKASEIPSVMEAIIQTATAANEKLEGEQGVAARMTDMIMAWGMSSNQAGRAGDILAKASIASTVTFNQLAESMKYSQDVLKGLHMTFEESVAMMAVLGDSGIKASMSGTSLANAWREITIALGGGSKKKNLALHSLGLSPKDLMDTEGNLKRPLDIIDKIKQGVQGMGDVQRQNVLNDLFGVRGKRGINPLIDFLSKGPSDKWMGKSLTDMVKMLTNESAGSNMKIIEEKMKGAAFQAAKFEATWKNFKIAIGDAVMPLLNAVLPKLTVMLQKLTDFMGTSAGHRLVKILGLTAAILIPMGALLTITGLIGRAFISMSNGAATFLQAGKWLWNTLISKALTYLGIMNGINANERLNKAGRLIDGTTGRFIKTAGRRMGRFGKFGRVGGLLGNLLPNLTSFGRGMGGLLPLLGNLARAFSVVGLVSMGLSMIGIDLRQQFNLIVGTIKYVIGTIMNILIGAAELLSFGMYEGPGGGFWNRQADLGVNAYDPNATEYWQGKNYDSNKYGNSQQPLLQSGYHPVKENGREVNVHIYTDGAKTVSKKIESDEEINLMSNYGYSH